MGEKHERKGMVRAKENSCEFVHGIGGKDLGK
jgi:hypothetical protein